MIKEQTAQNGENSRSAYYGINYILSAHKEMIFVDRNVKR